MDKQKRKEMIHTYKEQKYYGGICLIKNTDTGTVLLEATTDLKGSKNRFEFAKKTGTAVSMKLQQDWKKSSGNNFIFEIVEVLEMADNQTLAEYQKDLQTLKELWLEKYDKGQLY